MKVWHFQNFESLGLDQDWYSTINSFEFSSKSSTFHLKQFHSFIISGPKLDERWGRRWRCRRRLRGFRFPPRRSRRRRGRKFGQHSHGSCGTRKVVLRYAGKENLLLSLNITSLLILNIWIEISLFYFSQRKPTLNIIPHLILYIWVSLSSISLFLSLTHLLIYFVWLSRALLYIFKDPIWGFELATYDVFSFVPNCNLFWCLWSSFRDHHSFQK